MASFSLILLPFYIVYAQDTFGIGADYIGRYLLFQIAGYLGIRGTLNFLVVLLPLLGGVFIDLLGYLFTFILVSTVMFTAYYLLKRENKGTT